MRSRLSPVQVVMAILIVSAPMTSFAQFRASDSTSEQQFLKGFVAAAIERTHHIVRYDPAYVRIPYPGGDVPADTGVCTDEIIRTYRAVGIDLQKEVHEDMAQNFSAYPRSWRYLQKEVHEDMAQNFSAYPRSWRWLLARPDSNIDHRRVPNLMVFFQRKGQSLPKSSRIEDYSPGDLVAWDLGGGVPHIGIVVDRIAPQTGRYMIVHNIGQGPKMEDVIFNWRITGHYRYFGPRI